MSEGAVLQVENWIDLLKRETVETVGDCEDRGERIPLANEILNVELEGFRKLPETLILVARKATAIVRGFWVIAYVAPLRVRGGPERSRVARRLQNCPRNCR